MPRPTKRMKLESVINTYDESSDEDEHQKGRVRKVREEMAKAKESAIIAQEKEKQEEKKRIQEKRKKHQKKINNRKNKRNEQIRKNLPKKDELKIGEPYLRKDYSVSLAIPGAILKNKDEALKGYIASQVARFAALFKVDEVVVFNEDASDLDAEKFLPNIQAPEDEVPTAPSVVVTKDSNIQLANILYYLETPPYLRSKLFAHVSPISDIEQLLPIESNHHLLPLEFPHPFREGVTIEEGDQAFIGKQKPVKLEQQVPPGLRTTIEIKGEDRHHYNGKIVMSVEPKTKGIYWGYNVRLASGLTSIFSECPYDEGYDLIVGVEKGGKSVDDTEFELPSFKHLLLVVGSENGLDHAINKDKKMKFGTNPPDIFNLIIDPVPQQGLRGLLPSEVVSLSLAAMRPYIDFNIPPLEAKQVQYSFIK